MLHTLLASLALTIGLTSAIPYAPHPAGLIPRQVNNSTNLLVAGAGQIKGFTYDGVSFTPSAKANISEPGKTASWMIFKEPNFLYAVDENSAATRLFNYDPTTGVLSNEVASWNGSTGVVHLAFNADQTKLIGSSYGQGQVDVWDASSPDGHLKLDKQIVLAGDPGPKLPSQAHPRAHQAVLDPSGRYFLVNDLGGDKLHIIDTTANYTVVTTVPIAPAGSGPRHGAFVSINGTQQASHYVVACELSNTLQLFSVSYDKNVFSMTGIHTISSYYPGWGPANASTAAAGELLVSKSGPAVIYVSNRNTGNGTDFLVRFALEAKSATDSTPQLVPKGQLAVNGTAPRMATFSKDTKQERLFVGNMNGENGMVALGRAEGTGQMIATGSAKFPNAQFSSQAKDMGFGPQFILAF